MTANNRPRLRICVPARPDAPWPAMETTHVAFQGGTKDGTTADYTGMEADSDLLFDAPFEPEERYGRTDETTVIDGVERIIFRLIAV